MEDFLNSAIRSVEQSSVAMCKFITANDTGKTGGHQAGFHITNEAWPLFFDTPGVKGSNKDTFVKIKWQDDFETESRFIYYGVGTRNEYRLTRFGRGFPFLDDESVGDLLIISKQANGYYHAYVLHSDSDIEDFLSYFNIPTTKTNQVISGNQQPEEKLQTLINEFVHTVQGFPETVAMAGAARQCFNNAYSIKDKQLMLSPDNILLGWIETEFSLFRSVENKVYSPQTLRFSSIDEFTSKANEILNRRKSRAGKSLEHHLANIFTANRLVFEEQVVTEENKKPDFVFPNGSCYHNLEFPGDLLTVLGAKTTCKDRWRQVINEADRVETKYLFTLQQGISSNQLKEMKDYHVKLVVPHKYIETFPRPFREEILDLHNFISIVKDRQERMPKYVVF